MLYDQRFPYVAEVDEFRKIEDPVVRDFIEGRTTR